MKNVLIIITTSFVPTGGLASVVMNYYRNINRRNLIIDIASTNKAPKILAEELEANAGRYIQLPVRKNVPAYFCALKNLCKQYDVVHINGNSATAAIELVAAQMAGVKVRIAHNHTARTGHPIVHRLLLPLFRNSYTMGLACSKQAGDWLFGEGNFSVLRNAIDAEKYRFDRGTRLKFREELGIPENAFVIGHVGKYNYPKNHLKLLEVFHEYQKKHDASWLLCVGYGPLQQQLEKKIAELGVGKKTLLTGERTDIPELLSTMDVFVFPSRWEGLGLAVIEAQASGLPCLLSDCVPKDVYLSSHVESLALEQDAVVWANKIDEIAVTDRTVQCRQNIKAITDGGYNIKKEAYRLLKYYLE